MKNTFVLLLFTLSLFAMSCSDETIVGSGNPVSEERNGLVFSKLSSLGTFEVDITIGSNHTLEVTADDNVIEHVVTEIINNELRIYLDDTYDSYQSVDLAVRIEVPEIDAIDNLGAGNISVEGITGNNEMDIVNTGSGNISLEGSAPKFYIDNEGSGNVNAFDFVVNECDVNLEGSGNLEITCTDLLDVRILGSGNVYYKGNPEINADVSGSGNVIDAN